MKWRLSTLVALAVFAASCGGSSDTAVIERQVSAADPAPAPERSICDDVEAFALGSHAGDDLGRIIDELARLAAVLGASEALPHVADMKAAMEDDGELARSMDAAAEAVDHAGYAACGVPMFTAMYVSTSFGSCFGRAPIAAGTFTPDSDGCEDNISPDFLPCFDADAGYVPMDCRTGEPVVLVDGEWVEA